MARILGRTHPSFCPYCRAEAGIDCPDSGRTTKQVRGAEKLSWRREADSDLTPIEFEPETHDDYWDDIWGTPRENVTRIDADVVIVDMSRPSEDGLYGGHSYLGRQVGDVVRVELDENRRGLATVAAVEGDGWLTLDINWDSVWTRAQSLRVDVAEMVRRAQEGKS